jgi:hypothetical protein
MASAAQFPFLLSKATHDGIIKYYQARTEYTASSESDIVRDHMQIIDRGYARETDQTAEEIRAKRANQNWDPTKFRNVIIPITLSQVESAVSYQVGVFCSGSPMFGVVASPQYMNEALQLEAVIADQQKRGRWVSQFQMFFRDTFKYNLGALLIDWETIKTATLDTQVGSGPNAARSRSTIWQGNMVTRMDLYNTFWDKRVIDPTEHHIKGEFCGYIDLVSRTELKAYIDGLESKQIQFIKEAFESPTGEKYFIPQIVQDMLVDPEQYKEVLDWTAWVGLKKLSNSIINYRDYYERTFLYAKIIPSDFNLRVPQPNTPQIWKFVIINHEVIVHASRMTNAHNYLPMLFGQAIQDGLGYQTKSFARNTEVFQHLASALTNLDIASRRRAIADRTLYNPLFVAKKDIESDNPAAKIPVRPAAYGMELSKAVYPFPYREDQQGANIQMLGTLMQFSNQVSGQNPIRQGQFVKGNKTRKEFEDVMGNATSRDQMTALLFEDQIMTPAKEIIKINILQFQGAETLINREKKQVIEVDPVALRKAVLEFKISDGLIPSDKIISGDEWAIALQVLGSSPQIAQGYNIAPVFSYLMKVRGADLTPFEKPQEQIAYEQAVAAWQQTVMQIIKANPETTNFPPQPIPQQFGWNPNAAIA